MNDVTTHQELDTAPLMQAAVEVAPFAMLVADRCGRVQRVNEKWVDLVGRPSRESMELGWLRCLDSESADRLFALAEMVGTSATPASADYEVLTPEGARWTRWWLHLRTVESVPYLFMAVADVHEEHVSRLDLEHMATHDPLTGLLNRRFFVESVEQALRRNERLRDTIGLLFIDLNGFKAVNDQGGHSTGDRVLGLVAGRLRGALRSSDLVGRLGGDEFAVLVERIGEEEQIRRLADRVADAVNGSIEVDGRAWTVTASVGLALGRLDDNVTSLFERADISMYEMKRSSDQACYRPTRRVTSSGRSTRPVPELDMAALRESVEDIRRALESMVGGDLGPEVTDF